MRKVAPRVLASVVFGSAVFLAGASSGDLRAQGEVLDTELHAFLKPNPKEAWRSIPWHPALGVAVLEASRLRKPLLLWAMNGHPLGCT